jgi:6-phospho-beta-glucosidase
MTRGEEVKKIEKQLMELYQDPKLENKPKMLEKRGGAYYSTAAISLINALKNDKNEIHIVNTQNRGVLSELPNDAVIETACLIGADGATPQPAAPLPASVRGLVQLVKSYENLTILASVYGDRNAAYHALLAHPLVGDAKKAKTVLEHLLQAHQPFLPRFFSGE